MAVRFRDYYEILGVPRTATAEEIKRAYRKLAREHHPDLQPPAKRAAAEERFKEINEAHEVLSDPEKRATYDRLGRDWQAGQDFTPPSGAERAAPDTGPFDGAGDFSEFFEMLFGRGAGPGGARVRMPGSDVEAELPVSLDEVLRGGRRRLTVDGRSLEVQIPAGVRDGGRIRLAGQGGRGRTGGPAGDLYLRIRLLPHERYHVAGDDLEVDLPLWPWQAVLGGQVAVDTPDGQVTLRVPAGTQTSRRIRLRERGLPRPSGGRGDLYAVVRVVIPEAPTAAERAAYGELQRHADVPADRPASVGRGR